MKIDRRGEKDGTYKMVLIERLSTMKLMGIKNYNGFYNLNVIV